MRTFVEAVLRFGLPVDFSATLIVVRMRMHELARKLQVLIASLYVAQPAKQKEGNVRSALKNLYSNLASANLTQVRARRSCVS